MLFPKQTKREANLESETLQESKLIELNLNYLNIPKIISEAQMNHLGHSVRNIYKELERVPRKEFKNADPVNKQELSVLPPHLWIDIFASYLSVKDCCIAMIACKFFGEITNANNIRERFFLTKTLNTRCSPHLFNELENRAEAPPFISRDLLTTLNTSISQYSLNRLTSWEEQPLEQAGEQGYILRGVPR